jgi:hypothetical protein
LHLAGQPVETAGEGGFTPIAPSGDRKDATAASTMAERDNPLRSARSAICFNRAGGK